MCPCILCSTHHVSNALPAAGYAANIATIAALASSSNVHIFADALNHASLIDGCRLAQSRGAALSVFRHCDYKHLRQLLREERRSTAEGRRAVVVTDGVFSMDGDVADLQA